MKDQEKEFTLTHLTKVTGRGTIWQILGGSGQALVRLITSFFLARLLSPDDFGLFGMAILVNELIWNLGKFGADTALVAKKNVSAVDISTGFWLVSGLRFVLFLLTSLVAAPLAMLFFREPMVGSILRYVSLTFLISIPAIIPSVMLRKQMSFRALAFVRLAGILIESILAILLVMTTDLGVWSLVAAMLASCLFIHIGIFMLHPWIPRFEFSRKSFRSLGWFGLSVLGNTALEYLKNNMDYILIGRILGKYTLGLYEYAYRIPDTIVTRIALPANGVIFSALALLQDDRYRMMEGFLKAIKYLTTLTWPILGGLVIVADIAVPLMWGEQWLPIIMPLRILCLAAALRCIFLPVPSIFFCMSRPDIPFKFGIFRFSINIIALISLGHFYGIIGVAWAMVLPFISDFILVSLVLKMTKTATIKLFRAVIAPMTSTFIMLLGIFCFTLLVQDRIIPLLYLPILICIGILCYILSMRFLFPMVFVEIRKTISTVLLQSHTAKIRWR